MTWGRHIIEIITLPNGDKYERGKIYDPDHNCEKCHGKYWTNENPNTELQLEDICEYYSGYVNAPFLKMSAKPPQVEFSIMEKKPLITKVKDWLKL